jgi:tRNA-dihydrouridine synthase 4
MILADCFRKSKVARSVEFSTSETDRPLVIQFAAKTALELADAAEFAAVHVSAIDLNCGCPQKWAIEEGIGSALLSYPPELIQDMIRQTKNRTNLPVSLKIRLLETKMYTNTPI